MLTAFFDNILANFRWVDIIDLAVVSVFVYLLLVWFLQTTSRSVLIGLIGFLSVFVIGRSLNLYLTSILFRGIFTILAFALVVLFQEELRRWFERLAFWGNVRYRVQPRVLGSKIDAIVEVVAALAERKVGALVVLVGKEPVMRHLEGGVSLRGDISRPLLISLFDPHTPGHDGAVIIENGRISRFSTHLPLSRNRGQIGELGTRHSAALGLSERSDSIVIVVSEERGVISIADQGRLTSKLTQVDLKEKLEKFFLERFPLAHRRSLAQVAFDKIGLKAFSVFVAAVIWLAVVYEPGKVLRSIDLPIEYNDLSRDLVLEKIEPAAVGVTFLGQAGSINLLQPERLKVQVNLKDMQEGVHRINLTPANVTHPANVSVYQISPKRLRAKILKFQDAELPIAPKFVGKLPKGLKIKSVDISPSLMKANVLSPNDPKKIVLYTKAVDLTKVKESVIINARIDVPNYVKLQDSSSIVVKIDLKIEAITGPPRE